MAFHRLAPAPAPPPPTAEQSAAHAYFDISAGSLLVDALAGTGKTSMSIQGLNLDRHAAARGVRRAICAFSKPVATELQRKVPPGVVAGTLHSLMRGVLVDHFGRVEVDRQKTRNVLATFAGEHFPRGARFNIAKLVSLMKNAGATRADLDDPAETLFRHLIERHGIVSKLATPSLIGYARRVLNVCAQVPETDTLVIDFDDMIWLPYFHDLRPHRLFDLLVVDEVQDTNRVQQANALSLSRHIIGVGDEHQAIFGFRGADTEAMASLRDSLDQPARLPLTICWRCPSAVLSLAQTIVPAIQPRPGAPVGEVREISHRDLLAALRPGDMVLCRVNAPLLPLLFSLWSRQTRAYIQGRSVGEDLASLVDQEERPGCSLATLQSLLLARQEREEALLRDRPDGEYALLALRDRYACLFCLIDNVNSVSELKQRLDHIFADAPDSTKVRLSSIHRAKGLEADRVFILEPHLLPHPRALNAWERRQERNLAYVAATRARQALFFVGEIPAIYDADAPPRQPQRRPTEKTYGYPIDNQTPGAP